MYMKCADRQVSAARCPGSFRRARCNPWAGFRRLGFGCVVLLVVTTSTGADYEPSAEHLRHPDRLIETIRRSGDFWLGAYDHEGGGFFTHVARDGTPGQRGVKHTMIQSRNAYGLVRAFMVTGDTKYLDTADAALRFMYDRAWDHRHGGWIARIPDGEPKAAGERELPRSPKSSFLQHYGLLGPLAMVEATRDPLHRRWADRGLRVIDEKLADPRPGVGGYFEQADHDWSNPRGKSFTSVGDAITGFAMFQYLLTGDDADRARLAGIGDLLLEHFVGNMDAPGVVAMFPAYFTADWEIDRRRQWIGVGHLLKTAWHLTRCHLLLGEERYRRGSERIFDHLLRHAHGTPASLWNDEVGIPRGQLHWDTGRVTQDASFWWSQEQAIAAGMLGYHATGRSDMLRVADRTLRFFMTHYWDHEHGEAFYLVDARGDILNANKGGPDKGGFHSIELFYSTYLYANLLYHRRPVSLYYRFAPSEAERSITLRPLAVPTGAIEITRALRDGQAFDGYDAQSGTLRLPAGVGGVFRVTFAPSDRDARDAGM